MISSISSFESIPLKRPWPKLFCWLAASVSDITAFSPNGNRTLLANGVIALFIIGKPADNNGPKNWKILCLDQ